MPCHPAGVLLAIAFVIAGLFVLTKSADLFVASAARLSAALSVPPIVIGAVVVGFGTSAPEMVVSAIAAGGGDLDIAVGNVVGSNIANLTLILGISALVCTLTVDSGVIRKEAPLAFSGAVLLAIFLQGGLERWEGVVLLVGMAAALTYILRSSRGATGEEELTAEVAEFLEVADHERRSTGKEALLAVLGLAGVIASAQVTVIGATTIADEIGLAEGFVGVTLVAIGTSLPELVTSVAAARRNEHDLIVGNLLGSNLFNSFAVGGLMAVIGPGEILDDKLTTIAVGSMLGIAALSWLFMSTGRVVRKWEAAALLAGYAITVPLLA